MVNVWQGRIVRGVFGGKSRNQPKNKLCHFCKQPMQTGEPVFRILKKSLSGRLHPFIKICVFCSEQTIQGIAIMQALMD